MDFAQVRETMRELSEDEVFWQGSLLGHPHECTNDVNGLLLEMRP